MKAFTISSHPFLQKTLCLVLLACLIAGCVAIGGGNQTAFAEAAGVPKDQILDTQAKVDDYFL